MSCDNREAQSNKKEGNQRDAGNSTTRKFSCNMIGRGCATVPALCTPLYDACDHGMHFAHVLPALACAPPNVEQAPLLVCASTHTFSIGAFALGVSLTLKMTKES